MEKIELYAGLADNYTDVAAMHHSRGELDKAIEYHEKAFVISRALGSKEGMADSYSNLGLVYFTRAEMSKAIACHEKALLINKVLGRKDGMANNYGNLGIVYESRGELDKAIGNWKKSLTLFVETGATSSIVKVQSWLDEAVEKLTPANKPTSINAPTRIGRSGKVRSR